MYIYCIRGNVGGGDIRFPWKSSRFELTDYVIVWPLSTSDSVLTCHNGKLVIDLKGVKMIFFKLCVFCLQLIIALNFVVKMVNVLVLGIMTHV